MSEGSKVQVGAANSAAGSVSVNQAVAQIAAAFASRESASVAEIVDLAHRLTSLFSVQSDSGRQLGRLTEAGLDLRGQEMEQKQFPALPVVPVDEAVRDDKVFCLCCGRGFTMLKRHLKAEHGLTEDEYRRIYALSDKVPLVAPNYSARKAEYAKRVGLGKYDRAAESSNPL